MFNQMTHDVLMSLTVKAFHAKDLDSEIRDFILFAAHKNGLVDEQGNTTPKYFSFMNDALEQRIRQLTGFQKKAVGLCACGCGRNPSGRSRYATTACRKKVSRLTKVTNIQNHQAPPVLSS